MLNAETPPALPPETPPSILSKAFDLLRAFNARNRVMTLSELARASGLPKSTVHRLLARLIELGAIEHHGGGYRIGLDLLQLGSAAPAAAMRDSAMPHLVALHRWTGCTVYLGVLRQYDVVYLGKIVRPNQPVDMSEVGGRMPANCTAIGKAMLAHEHLDDLADFLPDPMPAMTPRSITSPGKLIAQLRTIRQGDLARACGEARPGVVCIASPIVVKGFAVGAISVSYPDGAQLDPRTGTVLRDVTAELAREFRVQLANGRARWFPRQA